MAKSDSAAAAADATPQPGQYQAVYTDDDRKAGYILVKLGPKARVTGASMHGDAWMPFWEADDRHPNDPGMGGELLVVQGKTVKAFPTAAVRRALGEERLTEVTPQDVGGVHDAPPNIADLPAPTAPASPQPPQMIIESPDTSATASNAASK